MNIARLVVAVLAVCTVGANSSPALAQMTREQCADLAPIAQAVVAKISEFSALVDRPRPRAFNNPQFLDAGNKLEKARTTLLGPIIVYRKAWEEMSYQIQRCSLATN
jgi:hypothetical protein